MDLATYSDLIPHVGVLVLALAVIWLAMVGLDFLVLPFLPRGPWKRPWCWLQGHIDGEAFPFADYGWADVCTRCGRQTPSHED